MSSKCVKCENQSSKTLFVYPLAVISILAMNPKDRLGGKTVRWALYCHHHIRKTPRGNQLIAQGDLGNIVIKLDESVTVEAQKTTSTRVDRAPHGHGLFVNVSTFTRGGECLKAQLVIFFLLKVKFHIRYKVRSHEFWNYENLKVKTKYSRQSHNGHIAFNRLFILSFSYSDKDIFYNLSLNPTNTKYCFYIFIKTLINVIIWLFLPQIFFSSGWGYLSIIMQCMRIKNPNTYV